MFLLGLGVVSILGACSINDVSNTLIAPEKQSLITSSFVEDKREYLEGFVRVSFEAQALKNASTYHWFWGDGKESIERTSHASHNYDVTGNFPVILVISAGGTNTSVSKQEIVIAEEEISRVGGHKSPVAILDIVNISQKQADEIIDSQGLGVLALPIQTLAENQQRHWFWFDACKSYDPDGEGMINYKIDFGNRHYAQGKSCNVLYYYKDSGEYFVKLTVTDSRGAIGSIEKSISL